MGPDREAVEAARTLVVPGGELRLLEAARLPGAVDLITCATRMPRREGIPTGPGAPAGSGVGLRWEEALVATVGESLERLSLIPDAETAKRIAVASFWDLDGPALDPRRFNFYHDAFYGTPEGPARAFTREEPVPWFPARWLRELRDLWIPAEYVFFSCPVVPSHHWACTTSGVACHRSPAAALTSALCELVERDAFVDAWLRATRLPGVETHAFGDRDIDEVVARCGKAGVTLHLREMPTDLGIPSYLAIAEAETGACPAVGLGAATHLDGREAARKALLEAVHTWNWAYLKVDARGALPPVDDLASIRLNDFGEHVYLYAQTWMKKRVAFLLEPAFRARPRLDSAPPSAEAALWEAVGRIERAGFEVFAVDQTHPDTAARGYSVLRAVVPELLPLQTGRRIQQLRSPRVPARPNPDPHPFP